MTLSTVKQTAWVDEWHTYYAWKWAYAYYRWICMKGTSLSSPTPRVQTVSR